MLRTATVLIAFLVVGPSVWAGTEALDEQNGFRDLKFGADVDSVTGLTPVEGEGEESTWYVREGDSMALGAAGLTAIRYNFYKGQLAVVHLTAAGPDCDALLDSLQTNYGRGTKTSKLVKRSWWIGKLVSMSYEKNDLAACEVYILSKPIGDLKDADREPSTKTVSGE